MPRLTLPHEKEKPAGLYAATLRTYMTGTVPAKNSPQRPSRLMLPPCIKGERTEMKEVEKILKDRLKSVLIDRSCCLIHIAYYLGCCNYYEKNYSGRKYVDYSRYREAYHLSDLYRRISLYRDEIKVLVNVLKIIKEKQGEIR